MEANFPEAIKPSKLYSGKRELHWAKPDGGGRNTRYRLATVGGSAVVGDQINYLHMSEVSRWGNKARDFSSGLLKVTRVGHGEQFIESTANGIGGYFYDQYWAAKDDLTSWDADFFPWYVFDDYKTAFVSDKEKLDFERTLGKDPVFGGKEEHDLLGVSCEYDLGEDVGIERYEVTLEHLHWRRQAIRDVCQGSLDEFHQDYPTTDIEAFLASGRSCFNREALTDMQNASLHRHSERPPKIYTVPTGVETQAHGITSPSYKISKDTLGELEVFVPPADGREYRIGVDVAEGIEVRERDHDYSVAVVLDAETYEQCAMLRTRRCDPDQLAWKLTALAKWYAKAWLIVERNNHGLVTLRSLFDTHQYENIYSEQVQDERGQRFTKKLGFLTTRKSRPQVLDMLKEAIREREITMHSKAFLDEAFAFIVAEDGREQAQEGKHDDTIMATALALFGCVKIPVRSPMQLSRNTDHAPFYNQI